MNEHKRNIAIGLTVLVGLGMLAAMIFLFTGLPEMFRTGYTVKIHFWQTHDITPGDPIYLRGKRVGIVTDVEFTDGDPRKGVTITARVDSDIRIPRNIEAKVFTRGIVGKGYLTLIPPDDGFYDPATGKEIGFYNLDEPIILTGIHDTGASMLPPKLAEGLENLSKLAKTLSDLIAPPPVTQPATDTQPSTGPAPEPPAGLKGTIIRLNRTLDALYAIAGNADNQKNLRASLKNLAEATEQFNAFIPEARKSLAGTDELVRKLITDAEDIGKLLQAFQKTAEKINEGEGTAGKLLNDPKLYNNLLDMTEQIDLLIKDFRRLTEKWETKGIKIR